MTRQPMGWHTGLHLALILVGLLATLATPAPPVTAGVAPSLSTDVRGYQAAASRTDGPFVQVSAGGAHTCAAKTDGSVACWGHNDLGQAPATPPGRFSRLSAAIHHTCGENYDGTITCWGTRAFPSKGNTDGPFIAVGAGDKYNCAIKGDGSVDCWSAWPSVTGGDLYAPPNPPPPGPFVQISVGTDYMGGVKTDGALACWQASQAELDKEEALRNPTDLLPAPPPAAPPPDNPPVDEPPAD